MIRVLVVDDHCVVREGLKRIVSEAGDMTVAAEAGTAAEALAAVHRGGVDVVVTDLSMPGRGGLELLRDLRRERPKLPVLVLTVHGEEQYALRALKAGAAGYLTKEGASEELVAAIRKVRKGGRHLSAGIAERLVERLVGGDGQARHERLSDREFQVLVMLGLGRTVGEIAGHMALSVKTISTYRARLLEKMGMRNNAELVAYAVRNRLVE